MKILKITESQYKRLVRDKNLLNENVIFPYNLTTPLYGATMLLNLLSSLVKKYLKKDLYIKNVDGGKIYLDKSKYDESEQDEINVWATDLIKDSNSIKDRWDSDGFFIDTGSVDVNFPINVPPVIPNIDDEEEEIDLDDEEEETVLTNVLTYPVPLDKRENIEGRWYLINHKNEKVDPKYVYNYLIKKGLYDYQACAILGNIYYESRFNTGILGDSFTSIGLCQWHNKRLSKLSKFSIDKNKSITDKKLQLDYMWEELSGVYNSSVLLPIKKSKTIKDASYIWARYYEACQYCDNINSSKNKKRLIKAKEYLDSYGEIDTEDYEENDVVTGGGSLPTEATSTSPPSPNRWGKPHHGYDIVGPYKSPCLVVANTEGVVTYASKCGSYGNLVEIKHGDNEYTAYGHLNEINVYVGQKVKKNDVIGEEGNTGHSTGRHLHFELRVKRPNGFKNRCGEGSPFNEVYGYSDVPPIRELNNYFYFKKG